MRIEFLISAAFAVFFISNSQLLAQSRCSLMMELHSERVVQTKTDNEPGISGLVAVRIQYVSVLNTRKSEVARENGHGNKVVFEDFPVGSYSVRLHTLQGMYQLNGLRHVCKDSVDFLGLKIVNSNIKIVAREEIPSRPTNPLLDEDSAEQIPARDPNRFTIMGDPNLTTPNSPRASNRQISGGVLNGKALSLPKPPYPPEARAVRASGAVSVLVLINEEGNVVSSSAISGHPLLQAAAVTAARMAKFAPTAVDGQPVTVRGVITYNFVP